MTVFHSAAYVYDTTTNISHTVTVGDGGICYKQENGEVYLVSKLQGTENKSQRTVKCTMYIADVYKSKVNNASLFAGLTSELTQSLRNCQKQLGTGKYLVDKLLQEKILFLLPDRISYSSFLRS